MWVDAFCEFPFNRARITCEGNLAMCCFMRCDPLKPESDAYVGNVLDQTFDEVWFGETAEAIRDETRKGNLHSKCKVPGCPYMAMSKPYPKQSIIFNEYPNFLELDLPNTHCNVGGKSPGPKSPACIMCERSAPWFRPEEDRLFEVLDRIKHIVPNLQGVHIQGLAEPFLQTRESGSLLFDALDALDFDNHADQITVSLTTNGTLLKKSIRDEYLKRVPHSITNFSIDAATPETFKKIRIFDCFEKVIETLNDFSKERVRDRQFLRIHNNINIMNVHEVVGMVQIAANANVEYVEFNPTDGFNHKILVNEENCGLFKKAQQDIIDECNRLEVPYNFIRPLDLGMTDRLVQLTL